MRGVMADIRHALRVYRRTPASSLIAIAVLAIGMAFVAAFLSMYVDLVLRPHAGFEQSGRLVTLGQNDGNRLSGLPFELIERINDEMTVFDQVVGFTGRTDVVGDPPMVFATEYVTRGFFDELRPRLVLGRGFESTEHEPEAERVVVISYRYWQDNLGGDPDVIDTTLEITLRPNTIFNFNGPTQTPEPEVEDYRIIGVMAREMPGLASDRVMYWLPFERIAPVIYGGLLRLQTMSLTSIGRTASGVSVEAIVEQLNARYLDNSEELRLQSGMRLDAIGGIVRNMNQQRDTARQLRLFLVGSLLLALVAAANVSLFLLARAPGRRRELGIRLAVGAPLRRLARQLASESALLVVVAAALGLVLSIWLGGFLRGLAFLRQAAWTNVTLLDWRVVVLVGGFLALVTLLVSLAPVFGLKRLGIAASSRQVAARATLAQRIAGTAQIAIAGTMAGAAIAFGWYLGELVFGYPGFETRDLHVVRASPAALIRPASGGPVSFSTDNIVVELARLQEAIESIPGVDGVSIGGPIPGASTGISRFTLAHPLDPTRQMQLRLGSIDEKFIGMLGLRLISGREPMPSESGAAVVTRSLALEYWNREDIVGESLPFSLSGGQRTEIVGVMEDVAIGHPAADPEPIMFLAGNTNAFLNLELLVHSALPSAELQRRLQALSADGGIELSINSIQPLAQLRGNLLAADRARAGLTIGTAVLVVLLAAFGFYGTQRYLVMAGRREYAIRASLGAGPTALGRLVLQRGLMLGLPGLIVGALLAFLAVAWLRDDFVSRDISPLPVSLAVVAGLVLLIGVASLGPARRARRTQPAPLLRED